MNGASLNLLRDRLEKLKADFPEIFSEDKIDMEKFKANFTDDINFNNERYVLNWAGKSDAFKVLQIPTTATLKPEPEQSVNFDTTENIFIEGENLEVLKVLQKSYYGKIKCIIIDPPYNTGNDSFIYPDSFKENKADYEKRIGDKDEEGYLLKEGMFRKNSKDSGHYHSNWLSMMYPRLFLAKNLLREDGVIFVHIDDNEVHNLRMIMNEIFGEENFVASIIWQKKFSRSNDATYFSTMHDYILCFSRNHKIIDEKGWDVGLLDRGDEENGYSNPDNDERGAWTSVILSAKSGNEKLRYEIITPSGRKCFPPDGRFWSVNKEKYYQLVADNRIWFGINGEGTPRLKTFLSEVQEGLRPNTIWFHNEVGHNQEGRQEFKKIFEDKGIFDSPKPVRLIKYILRISNAKAGDIVLDFFGGSGTTSHAVLELNKEDNGNRKFILVQLPERCDENSEACKAGYKTIADISKERIRRVIKKIETEQAEEKKKKEAQIDFGDKVESKPLDLGFKAFKLSPSNFKIWRGNEINEENLVQQLDAFTNPVREGSEQENILYELILKAGYLLTDKVEKTDNFYSIKHNELIIATDKISQVSIDKIISLKPKKVITLDILFKDNDQLKTNTVLQMKDEGVDFKTI
jgi:adenine-specific DNA-methyltransferase